MEGNRRAQLGFFADGSRLLHSLFVYLNIDAVRLGVVAEKLDANIAGYGPDWCLPIVFIWAYSAAHSYWSRYLRAACKDSERLNPFSLSAWLKRVCQGGDGETSTGHFVDGFTRPRSPLGGIIFPGLPVRRRDSNFGCRTVSYRHAPGPIRKSIERVHWMVKPKIDLVFGFFS